VTSCWPCILAIALVLGWEAPARATGRAESDDSIELVETAPVETTLGHADLPQAADVWLAMVQGATRSLDFAEFYAVDKPGTRLAPIMLALEAAGRRGVRVRFLADAGFAREEPDTLARLEKMAGVTVLRLDWARKAGGGVQHAKYFIVDGREAYLGSQNFDWRSLEHIQELGLRVRVPEVVRALQDVFETDWALGTGAPRPRDTSPPRFPVSVQTAAGKLDVTFEASPPGWLPDENEWGLPKLTALIDSATRTVRVQLLTYRTTENGVYFDTLETALRRAAARGVRVELLLSDWSKSASMIGGLESMSLVPGITVKLITIPQWSGGFIPYARVAHAKYLVVDGERAWIGTSNWERSYFYQTRNVGLILDGASLAGRLDRFFADGWNSPYATAVDPCASYAPPRVGP
jgi:phosphatidylserine/phosphatidylglycerophosphate/cardiolipin synthase-like enzyme